MELTDQLVGGLKVSGSNRVVLMTTAIPDSAQDQLVQLPAMIMTQFMMNAMLGGPGGAMPPDKPATFSSPGNLSDEESSVEGEFTSNVTTPLPDWSGIKLLAFLGSNSSATPKDREQGTPLRVELNIRWNGADEDNVLVAAGRLKFDEGTSEAGSTFTPLANRAFGSIDSLYRMPLGKRYKSGFIELGRGEFTLPKVDTGPVTSLNGSFAAIKGTLIKKVVITKIRDAIGKPSEDPELVAAGFEITKPEEDIEIAQS